MICYVWRIYNTQADLVFGSLWLAGRFHNFELTQNRKKNKKWPISNKMAHVSKKWFLQALDPTFVISRDPGWPNSLIVFFTDRSLLYHFHLFATPQQYNMTGKCLCNVVGSVIHQCLPHIHRDYRWEKRLVYNPIDHLCPHSYLCLMCATFKCSKPI
jgi:hypothetical protein